MSHFFEDLFTKMPNIVACSVSRRSTCLTSFTADKSSQYVALMQRLLTNRLHDLMKVPSHSGSLTYAQFHFHFLVDVDLIFMICCKESIPLREASIVLQQIQSLFLQHCAHCLDTNIPNSLDKVFRPIISRKFVELTNRVDTLTETKNELEKIKHTLTDNVSKIMTRGDNLSNLSEQSSLLNYSSRSYNLRSRSQSRRSGMSHCCVTSLVVLFILMLLLVGLLVFVDGSWNV
ncbi:hypothetical protein GEMRC1_008040 [Eukaryota sp. GEM-RC1]